VAPAHEGQPSHGWVRCAQLDARSVPGVAIRVLVDPNSSRHVSCGRSEMATDQSLSVMHASWSSRGESQRTNHGTCPRVSRWGEKMPEDEAQFPKSEECVHWNEKNMTLSVAIRRGSRMRPQGFYALFGPVQSPTGEMVFASCVLGAAWDACGLPKYPTVDPEVLVQEFPELNYRRPNACPECGFRANRLSGAIIHLNDFERWPRERIADWIDSHPDLSVSLSDQNDCPDPPSEHTGASRSLQCVPAMQGG
jgi:hypothetical protein